MVAKKKAMKKRAAKKRELLKPTGDARYVRRDDKGEFEKVVDGELTGYFAAFRQSFIWAGSYLPARATYPGTARAALLPPYLVLLRMGFAVPLLLPETRWALTPPFHHRRSHC